MEETNNSIISLFQKMLLNIKPTLEAFGDLYGLADDDNCSNNKEECDNEEEDDDDEECDEEDDDEECENDEECEDDDEECDSDEGSEENDILYKNSSKVHKECLEELEKNDKILEEVIEDFFEKM